MDAAKDFNIKWNKSERERQIPYDITYMWDLKITQMNLSVKQYQEHREHTGGCQGGGSWERIGLGVWDSQLQTGIYRIENNKVLL